jgi:rod shape-determining protein MreC
MNGDSPGVLKSFAVMGAVIGLWWVLPAAVHRVARESFYEFQAPLFIAESRMKDLRRYWELSSRPDSSLIEAGRDLARINADMAVRLAQTGALREENHRLEDALRLPSRPDIRQIVARVAQRDINRWWSRIILAKGRVHGVREGQPVINGGGVVGRVSLAHANTCEVELITDPAFRISANLEGDDSPVVYRGSTTVPFETPRGLVTHIRADFKNETGRPLRLVTSGLGGVFLGGLYIGTMETDPVETADGLFREARVLVRPDLLDIQEATILAPVGPEHAREAP